MTDFFTAFTQIALSIFGFVLGYFLPYIIVHFKKAAITGGC